ncbi:MAG: MMPL family transporter [Porticoccaceae bacterium]
MGNVVTRFSTFCIRQRIWVLAVIAALTCFFAVFAVQVEVKTVFSDMLPQSHTYVKTHKEFKDTFGGSNMVSIMLEVEDGDIFQFEVLQKIQKITRDLQRVNGVNQFQVISLASKKLKEIRGSTYGIETIPLMWPDIPDTQDELEELRESVLNNPLVYGSYVSADLKSTLITVDFIDHLVDYETVFKEVGELLAEVEGDGVHARVSGEPILYGWVRHYLPETISISLLTVLGLIAILFILTRTWRGTLLPLLAGLVSSIWALGIGSLLGFNFDPLIVVVAFLITARSISHSVQLVTRFDDVVAGGVVVPRLAARISMTELFRPGMLGVVADAGAILVVVLTPIPLLQKVAIIGAIWVATISVAAVVLTPVLLSWLSTGNRYAHPLNVGRALHAVLNLCVKVVTTRARYVVLMVTAGIFLVSLVFAFKIEVGDAQPGSPILWPDAKFNLDAEAINQKFLGADRMFVVFRGEQNDALKEPEVLAHMDKFQRFMEAQPEIGGTLSFVNVLEAVKSTLYEGNPRYEELGNSKLENGELMYLYLAGSEPGDLERFSDTQYKNGAVTLFFRDHKGATIRTALSRVKEFAAENPMIHADYQLAGGLVGVLGAVNEVLLAGQIEAIALALLVVVLCCAVVYRSSVAGMFFMVPVLLANTLTFMYMAINHIGMNINTVPVVALGIGLGVDYSFYIIDGIKEELEKHNDPIQAITKSLHSAGFGVLVTGGTLVVSVMLWTVSSLRFQAEMGLLISLWLLVSALSALFVMPAMAYVFRPAFIFADARRGEKSDVEVVQRTAPASK